MDVTNKSFLIRYRTIVLSSAFLMLLLIAQFLFVKRTSAKVVEKVLVMSPKNQTEAILLSHDLVAATIIYAVIVLFAVLFISILFLLKNRAVISQTKESLLEIESLRAIIHSQKFRAADKELKDLRYALDQLAIVGVTDVKGNIIFANEKFSQISKYTNEELIGQNHRILNSGHHPKEFFVEMWRTISSGNIWRSEVCNKDKYGEIYWVDTIIVPILNEENKPRQYIAIRNDITERVLDLTEQKKQSEQLMQANKELTDLRFALDKLAIVGVTDVKGNIIFANDKFSEISKYSNRELIGQNHRILNSGHHPKEFFVDMWKTISSGKIWRAEVCNKDKYGELYWVDTIIVPILNKEKKPYQYIAIRNDVTEKIADLLEQKKQAKQLQQANKEMSDLRFALNKLAIVGVTDVKGNIIFANDKFSELSKYSNEELIGQNHRILNSGYHPREFFVEMWKTISNGKIWRGEVCNKDRNGELYWVDTIIVPILNEQSKPYQYIAIRNDITERVKKENDITNKNTILEREVFEAERTAKLKGDFLANMSHEIRTPMNGVIGMIDLLRNNTETNDIQKEYLDIIKFSSKTLLTIINDILDLSKMEAGKMTLTNTSVNLHKMVNHVKDLFKTKLDEKNLAIEIVFGIELPENIFTDAIRVQQVLSNFVSNAIKFTDTGVVRINVELLERNGEDFILKFSVSDTGVGMHKDEIKNLFQSFNQLDSSSQKKYEGTGLGLAISKKIVELFQGEVNVESEFGKGSVFSFTIHTVLSKEQEEDVSEIVTVIDESLLGLRILLVDDKQVNLIVARTMLLSLGCKVELAKNGKEAIDIYEKGKFDIVLMDVQMPIMDGVEAATLIKEKDREMNSVIALTANAMEGDREKYISLGFDEYLSKPIEYEVLKHKLIQVKNRTSKN